MRIVNKKEGETPLQALERLREDIPELLQERLSYAGRLDPMASGVMIVIEGAENDERSKYLALDKTYEIELLLGVSTDTHDILGFIDSVAAKPEDADVVILQSFVGSQLQEYPLYSSKTVGGVQLHTLARNGTAPAVAPNHSITIHSIEFLERQFMTGEDVARTACERIKPVAGDFRQNEITKKWEQFGKEQKNSRFEIWRLRVDCSSGSYMRILARDIGRKANLPALAWKIRRTRVGPHSLL